jgi:hypothetical protein
MNNKINKLKQLLTHEAMVELTIEYNASFNAKEQKLLLKAWLDKMLNATIIADMPSRVQWQPSINDVRQHG